VPVRMVSDIAKGMQYLHACPDPVLHCDLTPANLLVWHG